MTNFSENKLYFDSKNLAVMRGDKLPPTEKVNKQSQFSDCMLRVVMLWNDQVMENRLFAAGETISVGRSLKNNFVLPTIGLPARFNLITSKTDKFTLRLPHQGEALDGLIQLKDQLYDLKSAQRQAQKRKKDAFEIEMSVTDRGVLEIGFLTFYFDFVPTPPELAREKASDRLDPLFIRVLMTILIIFLMFFLTLQLIPRKEKKTIEDIEKRFAKVILEKQPVRAKMVKLRLDSWGKKPKIKHKKSQGKAGEGKRRAGKEGKRGRLRDSRKGVVTKKRTVDQAGLLSVFSKSRKYSALSDLLGGEGGIGTNIDKHFRPGGSRGKSSRWARGIKGAGLGGGGTARTGIGGLGTKGRGTGKSGYGKSDIGGKGESAVTAVIEESETYVMGSIDRQAVLRVILNNINAIQYCYERQLTQSPNLAGKLVVNFVIGGNGRVRSSSVIRSSMGSPAVESCVARRIKRLIFPKPPYGIVEVKFPFIFRSAS